MLLNAKEQKNAQMNNMLRSLQSNNKLPIDTYIQDITKHVQSIKYDINIDTSFKVSNKKIKFENNIDEIEKFLQEISKHISAVINLGFKSKTKDANEKDIETSLYANLSIDKLIEYILKNKDNYARDTYVIQIISDYVYDVLKHKLKFNLKQDRLKITVNEFDKKLWIETSIFRYKRHQVKFIVHSLKDFELKEYTTKLQYSFLTLNKILKKLRFGISITPFNKEIMNDVKSLSIGFVDIYDHLTANITMEHQKNKADNNKDQYNINLSLKTKEYSIILPIFTDKICFEFTISPKITNITQSTREITIKFNLKIKINKITITIDVAYTKDKTIEYSISFKKTTTLLAPLSNSAPKLKPMLYIPETFKKENNKFIFDDLSEKDKEQLIEVKQIIQQQKMTEKILNKLDAEDAVDIVDTTDTEAVNTSSFNTNELNENNEDNNDNDVQDRVSIDPVFAESELDEISSPESNNENSSSSDITTNEESESVAPDTSNIFD